MFERLTGNFIDRTKEQSEALNTMRNWQDLLPVQPKEFKELTFEHINNINAEIYVRKHKAAQERLKEISAQINLAKFEGAI